MTVLDYSLITIMIGIPYGFVGGIIVSVILFMITDMTKKELLKIAVGIQILIPTGSLFIVFVFMLWFSIFDPNLNIW